MTQEKEDQGFTVSDRRQFRGEKGEGQPAPPPSGEPPREAGAQDDQAEAPPLDFLTFVLSLAGSVHIHLGEIPDPTTGQKESHPELAKQTIDLLSILQEKTKGNLTADEDRILDTLLSELRMRYLKAINFIP